MCLLPCPREWPRSSWWPSRIAPYLFMDFIMTSPMRSFRSVLAGLTVLSIATAACGGGGDGGVGPNPPPAGGGGGALVVGSVAISPSTASVQIGSTTTLAATVKDAAGNVLAGRAIAWTTSDAGVAGVSGTGVVTANTVGTATITGTSEGKSGTAIISVTAVPVASVSVAPSSATIPVGTATTLTVTVKDAAGSALAGRTVNWTTSDANVANVSSAGIVTANAVGTATITATSEGKSATAIISVVPVPVATVTVSPSSATISYATATTFTATLKDAAGNTLTGRATTWTTADASIASVNQSGVVFGQGAGTTTITATSEGKSGSATITVTKEPVASIVIIPDPISLHVGESVALSFAEYDSNGNQLQGRSLSLTVNNTAIVTNSQNVLTGRAVGSTTLTFVSEGVTKIVNVTVDP